MKYKTFETLNEVSERYSLRLLWPLKISASTSCFFVVFLSKSYYWSSWSGLMLRIVQMFDTWAKSTARHCRRRNNNIIATITKTSWNHRPQSAIVVIIYRTSQIVAKREEKVSIDGPWTTRYKCSNDAAHKNSPIKMRSGVCVLRNEFGPRVCVKTDKSQKKDPEMTKQIVEISDPN